MKITEADECDICATDLDAQNTAAGQLTSTQIDVASLPASTAFIARIHLKQ